MKRFLILLFLIMVISIGCQQDYVKDVDYDSAWEYQGVTKLASVQYTPKSGFAGHSSLVLEYDNGLVQIFSDIFLSKKQFVIGAEYDVYEHKVTKKIKIRKLIK